MPHWMRVFCRRDTAPTPGEILQALSAARLPASLDPEAAVDPLDLDWGHLVLRLGPDTPPLVIDRDRAGNGVVREEVEGFLARLTVAPNSGAKRFVIAHLRRTTQVIGLQVPTASIDPTGWSVAHALVRLLVRSSDGILQADGEGFYRGEDLVVPLP